MLDERSTAHPSNTHSRVSPRNISIQRSSNDIDIRHPSIIRMQPVRHRLIKLHQQMSTDNLPGHNTDPKVGLKQPVMRVKSEFRSTKNADHLNNRKSEILMNRNNEVMYSINSTRIPPIHNLSSEHYVKRPSEPQKIFIVRHGERVDSTFGINWIDAVFDKDGHYRRLNLNLPRKIPVRKSVRDFLFDPPLTELGLIQSKIIGEELLNSGSKIDSCYSSPALRCVQTASMILEGFQRKDINIRIEPCLFEFLKWHPVMPMSNPFMSIEELKRNGYNVDIAYRPVYPLESLRKDEDESMFYTRSHAVMLQIIRNHEPRKNHILIVGHAPTLEVTTRQLLGSAPRIKDLKLLVRQIPYLSLQTIERQQDNQWKLKKPPIPPLKHCALEPFDWKHIR